MSESLTLTQSDWRKYLSFFSGLGMIASSILTIRHFYLANYPQSIFKGSFCDISSFFNCDSSAYSSIAQFYGVPLGYFGLVIGVLVALGVLFPSSSLEKTNKTISMLNALGVVGLFFYSVFITESLCLLCMGYYVFSLLSFGLFWKYGMGGEEPGWWRKLFSPSLKHLLVFALITAAGAYSFHLYTEAKKKAMTGGVAAEIVREYYSLEKVPNPSFISPFWTSKATEKFEKAPIHMVMYADFMCPDCLYLYQQLKKLKKEYQGKLNIAFQFFPLDDRCNGVVDKDFHPGSCELSYIAAHDPAKFKKIHQEIFENFKKAHSKEWRLKLAQKYGLKEALTDKKTQQLVKRIIETGAEYEKTSDKYTHGIRSTPTMIINNRMIIGTLPYAHLKAIFDSLLRGEEQTEKRRFLERWVDYR